MIAESNSVILYSYICYKRSYIKENVCILLYTLTLLVYFKAGICLIWITKKCTRLRARELKFSKCYVYCLGRGKGGDGGHALGQPPSCSRLRHCLGELRAPVVSA